MPGSGVRMEFLRVREVIKLTKQELQEYFWTQKNIEKLEARIEELMAVATKQTSQIKSDVEAIHGTGYNDRQGDVLAEIADLRAELETELQKALLGQLEIEQAIKALPEREKYLIRARYIERKTWEHICVDMQYSWKQVHRIHAKALQLLAG